MEQTHLKLGQVSLLIGLTQVLQILIKRVVYLLQVIKGALCRGLQFWRDRRRQPCADLLNPGQDLASIDLIIADTSIFLRHSRALKCTYLVRLLLLHYHLLLMLFCQSCCILSSLSSSEIR